MNNLKSIFVFLLFGCGVSLLGQEMIQQSNLSDGTFRAKSVQRLNWMNEGQFYSALKDNKVVKYDVRTGEKIEVLADGDALSIDIDDYSFSEDERVILLMTDRQSVFRRSYTAIFYIYSLGTKTLSKLSEGRQAYATLSPDNLKVAFTRDNNLFYVDLINNKEIQVTDDGKRNSIINGSTDWVYEEELSLTKAFDWSPDSKNLAYYRMDESAVREYNMQVWNEGSLYPEDYRYKYPKAGEANSTVEIIIYQVESNAKTKADLGSETDIYIPRIYWTKNADLLAIQRLNRLQNRLDILHVVASTGVSKLILSDESNTYIDFTFCDDLTYLENGKQFLFSSEQSGYKHFYLYNLDGSLVRKVTSGEFEAVSLVGLDQRKKTPVLYYISTEESPLEQHLYSISLSGKGKKKLTNEVGSARIDMSDDCTYYMNYFSSATKPLTITLNQTADNQLIKVMEDNADLQQNIQTYGLADKEFFEIKNDNGDQLNGFFLKPSFLEEGKEYPLLIFQYSGPGSQNVSNRWGGGHYIWHQMLVQKGYIVAVVDTRGTGYRGEAFKKVTYRQMGKYEVEDLISTAKTLGGYGYIDASRIGVWGWSYGGYMSSLSIFKGADVFKTAIAVAPVTSWRYYDTIYTERYMRTPQENAAGYDDNSPVMHADKLKGNFLLVHGTGDDNVHFQNSVALQDKLTDAGKQFRSFYYPDRAHGLGNRRPHLYQMMTDYILENL